MLFSPPSFPFFPPPSTIDAKVSTRGSVDPAFVFSYRYVSPPFFFFSPPKGCRKCQNRLLLPSLKVQFFLSTNESLHVLPPVPLTSRNFPFLNETGSRPNAMDILIFLFSFSARMFSSSFGSFAARTVFFFFTLCQLVQLLSSFHSSAIVREISPFFFLLSIFYNNPFFSSFFIDFLYEGLKAIFPPSLSSSFAGQNAATHPVLPFFPPYQN